MYSVSLSFDDLLFLLNMLEERKKVVCSTIEEIEPFVTFDMPATHPISVDLAEYRSRLEQISSLSERFSDTLKKRV